MAQDFQTLPGFRDFFPDDCAARNALFEVWRRVARRYGFVEYEGPVLESTDLYQRKSGEEIVDQLFCFEDKGGREVSMRPELTPTLARMAAARQRDFRKPLRWFSIGQFFRYERQSKGRGREFYQFNCDILGEDSILADAELMALSIDLMTELGFGPDDFRLRVSDRNAWMNFAAENGIGEERLTEFLQAVDRMERTPPDKTEAILAPMGLSISRIEEHIASGPAASPDLSRVLEELESRNLGDYIEVDLGIVRGLAYYTGPVFEVFDVGKGMRAIAGGGRYDQLVGLIGGVEMPACGFAMGDMVITNLIRETEKPAARLEEEVDRNQSIDAYVILADPSKRSACSEVVQSLRAAGYAVQFSFSDAKVGKQFQAAEQAGARYAVVIGREFPELQLKHLADRSERAVALGSLLDAVESPSEASHFSRR